MANSGYLEKACSGGYYTFYIYWEIKSQSISGNSSQVYLSWGMRKTASNGSSYNYQTSLYSAYANIVAYDDTVAWDMRSASVGTEKSLYHTTIPISHNSDGTKSLYLYGYVNTKVDPGTAEISDYVTLPTIPRATTPVLSPSSADMGSSITINLTCAASSDFTHDLTYKLPNGTTGTIATGLGKTTKSWTVPDFAESVPNKDDDRTITITCVTKQGSSTIGTKTAYLTANVPASVIPTISNVATSEATAGIAAQFKAYIQGKSALAVSITAAGAEGSTITGYSTMLQGKANDGASFTSDLLTTSGSVSLVTTVTDSRGRTAKLITTVTVLAYAPPQVSAFSAYRVDASGNADDSGDFVAVSYAYTVPSLNGGNTAAMVIKYKRSIDADYNDTLMSGAALSADETDKPTTVISSDYRWDLQITVTDYFGVPATATVQLPSGQVILDILADGLGIGVGKTAEGPGLDINWAARLRQAAAFDAPVDTRGNLSVPSFLTGQYASFADFWAAVEAAAPSAAAVFVKIKDTTGWGPKATANIWYQGYVIWQNNSGGTNDIGGTVFINYVGNQQYIGTVTGTSAPVVSWKSVYGVGASTADARTNLGVSPKWQTLWTNSSPTSSFAGQTVTLSSSDYDYLLVLFRWSTSDTEGFASIAPKGNNVGGDHFEVNKVARYATRNSDTSYTFSDGYYNFASGYSDYAIPVKIIGIKI